MKKKKLINSFKYAFVGIFTALKKERNLKIHFSIMTLVIIFGFLLNIKRWEWFVCICLFGMVISAEMFNTAIEGIVDVIMPEKNDKAKFIKDVSAGAVLALAIAAFVIGILLFVPKIMLLFK